MKKETFVEGLCKCAKRPQCNPSFMNKMEANDLIWIRPLAIMDKGHSFNNFTNFI